MDSFTSFRAMRRRKQALSTDECISLLTREKRAALGVIGDGGYPYVLPVNFYYDPEDSCLYLHSAREGHKIESIEKNDRVCLTVWNQGEQKDGDWAYYVKSVIVFGQAFVIRDEGVRLAKVRNLGLKYYPSALEVDREVAKDGGRVAVIGIRIEHMTGKLVHEK